MCLLVAKPAGQIIPEEYLKESFQRNRDGAGFAWYEKNRGVTLSKGYFTVKELIEAIEPHKSKLLILHFRWATHGSKKTSNCHPFNAGGGWVAAHNGVFSQVTTEGDETDTEAFIRQHIRPMLEAEPKAILKDKEWKAALHKACLGSKMAFLGGKGKLEIINEKAGHWHKGIWYSNTSYKAYVPKPVTQNSYPKDTRDYYYREPYGCEPWRSCINSHKYGSKHPTTGEWIPSNKTVDEHMAEHFWFRGPKDSGMSLWVRQWELDRHEEKIKDGFIRTRDGKYLKIYKPGNVVEFSKPLALPAPKDKTVTRLYPYEQTTIEKKFNIFPVNWPPCDSCACCEEPVGTETVYYLGKIEKAICSDCHEFLLACKEGEEALEDEIDEFLAIHAGQDDGISLDDQQSMDEYAQSLRESHCPGTGSDIFSMDPDVLTEDEYKRYVAHWNSIRGQDDSEEETIERKEVIIDAEFEE